MSVCEFHFSKMATLTLEWFEVDDLAKSLFRHFFFKSLKINRPFFFFFFFFLFFCF